MQGSTPQHQDDEGEGSYAHNTAVPDVDGEELMDWSEHDGAEDEDEAMTV